MYIFYILFAFSTKHNIKFVFPSISLEEMGDKYVHQGSTSESNGQHHHQTTMGMSTTPIAVHLTIMYIRLEVPSISFPKPFLDSSLGDISSNTN